jgi:hypothetical protein
MCLVAALEQAGRVGASPLASMWCPHVYPAFPLLLCFLPSFYLSITVHVLALHSSHACQFIVFASPFFLLASRHLLLYFIIERRAIFLLLFFKRNAKGTLPVIADELTHACLLAPFEVKSNKGCCVVCAARSWTGDVIVYSFFFHPLTAELHRKLATIFKIMLAFFEFPCTSLCFLLLMLLALLCVLAACTLIESNTK